MNIIIYLQRFNKKILNIERLLELIITETLINGVYNYSLWEMLYTLPHKNLFSIKHAMENYIMVEEASVIRQDHPCFHLTDSL
jgi:hypothetical protein